MNIQLPGYETAFENEVYLRDSGPVSGNSASLKEVLLLRRYTHPSEEQVEKYFIKTVNNLASRRVRSDKSSFVETIIEKSLLPETRRHLGTEKCRECLSMIKALSLGLKVEDEKKLPRYLEALYGIVPVYLLEENLAAGCITDGKWYEMILNFPC